MDIKAMRENKSMTQDQLAKEIGTNIEWVEKLETGEINIENITFIDAIKLICELTPYEDEKKIARETYIVAKRIMQK